MCHELILRVHIACMYECFVCTFVCMIALTTGSTALALMNHEHQDVHIAMSRPHHDRHIVCCGVCCSALQCVAVCCSALQCVAVCCRVSSTITEIIAAHCNALQHATTHCNTLQHTATHCNTLQHTGSQVLSHGGSPYAPLILKVTY